MLREYPIRNPERGNAHFGFLMKSGTELKEDKVWWVDLWVDTASLKNQWTDWQTRWKQVQSTPRRTQERSEVFPPSARRESQRHSIEASRCYDIEMNEETPWYQGWQRTKEDIQRGKIPDDFPKCFQGQDAPKPGNDQMEAEDTKVKQALRMFNISNHPQCLNQYATEMIDDL